MAMVGSLALHTEDDQEDSDFFDQLANEFGDGDLGHLQSGGFQQEDKDRIDDAFSKLILAEEDSPPAPAPATDSFSIAEIGDTTGDEFWLRENKVEETAIESNSNLPANEEFLTGGDLQEESPDDNTPLRRDAHENSVNPHECVGENDSLFVEAASSVPTKQDNVVLDAPPDSITGYTLEPVGLKDAGGPNSGASESSTVLPSCSLREEISELDLTSFGDNERNQAVASMLAENNSGFSGDGVHSVKNDLTQTEFSTADYKHESPDSAHVEPANAQSMSNVDVDASESPGIKELQWSSFGHSYIPDAFGSYSDFFSELDSQTLIGSKEETTAQIGGYKVESLTDLAVLQAEGDFSAKRESLGSQGASVFYGSAAGLSDESGFWNHQGLSNHGSEKDNSRSTDIVATSSELHHAFESTHSGMGFDAVSEAGSVNRLSTTGNYEAQPQESSQQNWENMYPGWYFDYASNEWRQVEGWSAVEEQHSVREDGELSFVQTSRAAGTASDALWQSNKGQDLWSASGSNGVFAAGIHSTGEQQFANSSLPEQQVNWEEQYPGWYFDYQAQEWRQIVDDGQSFATNQDLNLGASQGKESVQNLQSQGGGWINEQVQPQHQQSGANQSIYSSEGTNSVFGSSGGVDMASLTRGMSFNSWAEPATGGSEFGQQSMEKTREGGNVNSWTGFQGGNGTVPNHTYLPNQTYQAVSGPVNQSQQDLTFADKSSFFDNSHGYFQSHNTTTSVMAGSRSSVGRPSHALVAFGFGGKLVTMKAPQLGNTEPLVLHDLNQLVSRAGKCGHNDASSYFSAFNRQGLSGPLGGATTKDVLKWVDERIENCEKQVSQGLNCESLWVLWGVLKIACLHYGKLRSVAGSAGIKSQMEDGPEFALGQFLAAAKSRSHCNQELATSLDVFHSSPTGHQLQAAINEIRNYLMDGRRKEALQFAQQGHLWGLALVLASQLGEKVYSDTIVQMAQLQFSPGSPMRTLLLLFAGQASELFKVQSVPLSAGSYGPFASAASNMQDSAGGMLRDWLGNLSIIAANPTKGDEQVIIHLGDSLWKDQGEVAGAHICYLVADASFESFSKEARLCLVGADHFKFQRTFATPQAIQRTELYEYARTLGNPQYVLVPFQPFKLLYAHMLTEAGRITEASRYCQTVIKNLKSAGRGPEIEFCKQTAVALEERLRLHSQGGYSLNFSTGKLVGKVMGTIDSTIHKIIGGPPMTQQPSPPYGNSQEWFANDGKAGSSTKATPLIPSASNNNLFIVNSQVDVPTRSVSEPNLIRSSTQEMNASTTAEASSTSPSQLKSATNNGGYLGRFGSSIAKALSLIRHNKEAKLGDENKFYYDEKLKRWVETGAEQSTEEAVLAPPPIVASFNSSLGSPSDAKSGGEEKGQGGTFSSSADLPPMPPSGNQFSARGRLRGVRSRYVDTFNKGNVQVTAKPSQSPIVPAAGGGWGVASTPSQFFASAPLSAVTNDSTDMLANGHNNDASPEFLKPTSELVKGSYMQVENEPLLPKNLNTSFMDVPVFQNQKHSSTGNMAVLADAAYSPVKSDASSLGNMARAVSWSGGSPNTLSQHRLSNGGTADVQMKPSMNSAAASALPTPPTLVPPPYAGHESGQMQGIAAEGMLSGSLQGASFGEMQEVEL